MTIRLAEVYQRQVGMQIDRKVFTNDKLYFAELDRVLDDLFEEAEERGMEWKDLAAEAGLAVQTVINLGERWTRRPQYRTVCLIAAALDRKIELRSTVRKKVALRIAS